MGLIRSNIPFSVLFLHLMCFIRFFKLPHVLPVSIFSFRCECSPYAFFYVFFSFHFILIFSNISSSVFFWPSSFVRQGWLFGVSPRGHLAEFLHIAWPCRSFTCSSSWGPIVSVDRFQFIVIFLMCTVCYFTLWADGSMSPLPAFLAWLRYGNRHLGLLLCFHSTLRTSNAFISMF